MTDWAKTVLAKHVSIKTKDQADGYRSDSTKRRSLLDKDSERRWLLLRNAIDESIKDLNDEAGSRLFSSDSLKASELRIHRIGESLLFSADYDRDAHRVVFRDGRRANEVTYTLSVEPVNHLDAVVLLDSKGKLVDNNTAEAQKLVEYFLQLSPH